MIIFLSAYPPRECGLASYSYHLVQALKEHFDSRSLTAEVCALEGERDDHRLYPDEVRYTLNSLDVDACREMASTINADANIQAVCVQHRFGLWGGQRWGENFLTFLQELDKPVAVVLHNVLPEPEPGLLHLISEVGKQSDLLITQTKYHASLLTTHYRVPEQQIRVIQPGAPVVSPFNKATLRKKHQLEGKLVLSTFGMLRRSKGIEHILNALDIIRQNHPEVVFLILGETHPAAIRFEGERYRVQLKDLIFRKGLQKHIRFVNRYLSQEELQEYMCLSDVYLHTSNNNLSGLVLALSCGSKVLAGGVPAVQELLQDADSVTDLKCAQSIAEAVEAALEKNSVSFVQNVAGRPVNHPLVWPNIAIAYQKIFGELVPLHAHYKLPELKPDHLYRLTTSVGLLHVDMHDYALSQQGYLLKDNAKALVAALLWIQYEPKDELLMLMLLRRFINVIRKCQQPDGSFYNQLDDQGDYVPEQNKSMCEESSMQAMWALSMLIQRHVNLPADLPHLATRLFNKALPHIEKVSSLKAIAYAIKALYHYNQVHQSSAALELISKLASRMQDAYTAVATDERPWFESKLKTANALLPKAMLLASVATGEEKYKKTAYKSFDFLLTQLFTTVATPSSSKLELRVMSEEQFTYSDDPLEVCHSIMTLSLFYQQSSESAYLEKMYTAFSWFMGKNNLQQSLYNPATGSCYDGLKNGKHSHHQGAESLVSYLLSRLTLEKYVVQLAAKQPVELPARSYSPIRGVGMAPDRPSISSGNVKVLAN